ncbi:MAG: MBOAT family protein, partial [Clostridia bacterium]|nr:MBOAT family protein [Clostridia bacterium]
MLVIFSLFFYAWGEPVYVLLMIGSAALNYGIGLWMGKLGEDEKKRKLALFFAVAADLVVLGVFKYMGLLVSTVN